MNEQLLRCLSAVGRKTELLAHLAHRGISRDQSTWSKDDLAVAAAVVEQMHASRDKCACPVDTGGQVQLFCEAGP